MHHHHASILHHHHASIAALLSTPPHPHPSRQVLEAGGLARLLANPKAVKEAVVFAAATGARLLGACLGLSFMQQPGADMYVRASRHP